MFTAFRKEVLRMFRDLLRKKQQISTEECIAVLKQETRGVLSVLGDNEYPYGTPMNHWYNEEDGCLYFHCGKVGHRLDALKKHDKASFCTFDRGVCDDGDWALRVKSVIVFGHIQIIDDLDTVSAVTEKFCRKFTQDETYIQHEIEQYAAQTLLLRLTPEHICGKSVKES